MPVLENGAPSAIPVVEENGRIPARPLLRRKPAIRRRSVYEGLRPAVILASMPSDARFPWRTPQGGRGKQLLFRKQQQPLAQSGLSPGASGSSNNSGSSSRQGWTEFRHRFPAVRR